MEYLTPVQKVFAHIPTGLRNFVTKEIWLKRDDLFHFAGVYGGKVRTCLAIALKQDNKGLVTAGSRASPQVNIVSHIARWLGVPCRVHTPKGELSREVQNAVAVGAELVQHPAGYNNVIIARSREDAQQRGWTEIPFGMECWEAVEQTSIQFANVPKEVKRIVVPVGSGMSLAGILAGMKMMGMNISVLGIVVGADPSKRLDKYAPGWKEIVTLQNSGIDYHKETLLSKCKIGGILLDPIYEAKCIPHLTDGDLLWCVGIHQSSIPSSH